VRIQFEITDDKALALSQMMVEAEIQTHRELFNVALTLLNWAMNEVKSGRVVASVDLDANVYSKLVIPVLDKLKSRPHPSLVSWQL
jgi:hypothetical protein